MITDIVIVPGALLLLPEYQGRAPAAPGLLESCVDVVHDAVATAGHVVVVHATDREARSTRPAIGLRVADHLLAATHVGFSVEHVAVAWDATRDQCVALGCGLEAEGDCETALLVVADGSARRTEKAPGHLDPRAAAVDDTIVGAVRDCATGGLEGLLDLDPALCADLLVTGRAPLQVLAAAVGTQQAAGSQQDGRAEGERTAYRVEQLEVSDQFGVLYVVAHLVADA